MTVRIAVVGDAMLDVDLSGRAERLTPDAPVPVLDDLHEQVRPGGAALAALIAARGGAEVTLVTGWCDDEPAQRLAGALADASSHDACGPIVVEGIPADGQTPVKCRIRAGGQSLLRLDRGGSPGTISSLTGAAAATIEAADVVLVSDYGRGLTSAPSVRRLLSATAVRLPVVWDPHPRGAHPIPGVALATPNVEESRIWSARAGLADDNADGWPHLAGRAAALVRAWSADVVAITLGERGVLVSTGHGTPQAVPAPTVTVHDVCGAGDAFAVTAAARLGSGHDVTHAVQRAVTFAADFVAAGGAARLGPKPWSRMPSLGRTAGEVASSVRARGGTVVATGGCFDLLHAGHVASLESARSLGDALVVCLNSDESVRMLKGPGRPIQPVADRRRVLESLTCVDAVEIFAEPDPSAVLDRLRPDVWAKGGDYTGIDLPETAVLDRWGGQAVALPYLPGRSTSGMVRAIATGQRASRNPVLDRNTPARSTT